MGGSPIHSNRVMTPLSNSIRPDTAVSKIVSDVWNEQE